MKAGRKRYILSFLLIFILLGLVIWWNVCSGSISLTGEQIRHILLGDQENGTAYNIIWEIRLPRILAALLLGGALSVSGFLLQTFFGNPIAGPYVLGISSGAKLVVAITMIAFLRKGITLSSWGMVVAAFLGSLLAMGFVLLVSVRVHDMSMLVVCGIMIGYICSAITDFCVTFADDSNIVNLHNWSLGSFSGMTWQSVRLMTVLVLLGVCVSFGKTDQCLSDGRGICAEYGCADRTFACPFDPVIKYFVSLCDSICRTDLLCGDRCSASG